MAAAAWPLIAKVGGGIAGGLLGRIGGGRTNDQKTAINDLLGANQLAFSRAEGLGPLASGFLQKGGETLQPSIDYWSKILSGDRQAISEVIGPETTRIAQNYEGAKTAATQFAPMGGGRSGLLAEMPFKRGQDISALISTLRPEAAKQMSAIAQQLSALGLDAEGIITSILSGIGGRGGSILGQGTDQQRLGYEASRSSAAGGSEIGRQIYEAIKNSGKKP